MAAIIIRKKQEMDVVLSFFSLKIHPKKYSKKNNIEKTITLRRDRTALWLIKQNTNTNKYNIAFIKEKADSLSFI